MGSFRKWWRRLLRSLRRRPGAQIEVARAYPLNRRSQRSLPATASKGSIPDGRRRVTTSVEEVQAYLGRTGRRL